MKAVLEPQLQPDLAAHEAAVELDVITQNRDYYDAEIRNRFAQPDAPEHFDLNAIAELLGGERAAVIHAMKEHDMLPERPVYFDWTATKVMQQMGSSFTRSDVLTLNSDPMSRARSYTQLPEYLGAEKQMVAIAIDALGLTPVRTFTRNKYGYYDENQIELIRAAVAQFGPVQNQPAGKAKLIDHIRIAKKAELRLISKDRIAHVLKLSGVEFQEHIEDLRVSEVLQTVDDRTKRVARFLTGRDALRVAQIVLKQRKQKKDS